MDVWYYFSAFWNIGFFCIYTSQKMKSKKAILSFIAKKKKKKTILWENVIWNQVTIFKNL